MANIEDRLKRLTETAADTPMGRLLRHFWHPVALADRVAPGTAMGLRILGEDLTLYRGASGRPYLVGGHCAHRLTRLHTGWVEGEEIRCVYHGWKYDSAGRCTERPAEPDTSACDVTIASYPAHEYGGLVFAWLGEGLAPAFELPRKDVFESDDYFTVARAMVWPCNWFQHIENSMDAAHVSFVHQKGKVGYFGAAVTADIPALDYAETDAGVRQTATRPGGNVRVSDWTFPNNNHIVIPDRAAGDGWIHLGVWMVPVDDTRTLRASIYAVPRRGEEEDRRFLAHFEAHGGYNPAEHHDELFEHGRFPEEPFLELTLAQDYVALMGQGTMADRARERLGTSDRGVAFLRKLFWRELDAVSGAGTPKRWRRLEDAADLPHPPAGRAAQ